MVSKIDEVLDRHSKGIGTLSLELNLVVDSGSSVLESDVDTSMAC